VTLTVAHITPLISLVAGLLILIAPALLNYIVAIYPIVAGAVRLKTRELTREAAGASGSRTGSLCGTQAAALKSQLKVFLRSRSS
jgi:hypothetical protein